MKEIILNKIYKDSPNYRKYCVFVDDSDFEQVNKYNWYIHKSRNTFYACVNINGKIIYMHKYLTGFKQTDHIDGNGLNNQRHNLRRATNQQNTMNKIGNKNSTSQYKGICWDENANKWRAYIGVNQKHIHLGLFKSEINAAQAYNFAAEKYFGEFARFNTQ